ncbi:MAG: FecR domain-containing protein, partial [Oceanospirillales bacterium]|nr:FecR domain-containing protein [Oceanospirillales bacterium]
MRARMSHLSMLLMILAINLGMAGAANAKSAAGTVILATGESWRLSTEGRTPLSRKASVYAGDHLITAEGSMTLRMQDNAIVNLQPHSKMIIHAYQPATAEEEAAIRFELTQGTVRTRTGKIGEDAHHRYRLDTPFAALGIRGTDYTVNLNGDALSVYVYSGGIRLAPFSDTLGCIQGNLGACSTPESADLS